MFVFGFCSKPAQTCAMRNIIYTSYTKALYVKHMHANITFPITNIQFWLHNGAGNSTMLIVYCVFIPMLTEWS